MRSEAIQLCFEPKKVWTNGRLKSIFIWVSSPLNIRHNLINPNDSPLVISQNDAHLVKPTKNRINQVPKNQRFDSHKQCVGLKYLTGQRNDNKNKLIICPARSEKRKSNDCQSNSKRNVQIASDAYSVTSVWWRLNILFSFRVLSHSLWKLVSSPSAAGTCLTSGRHFSRSVADASVSAGILTWWGLLAMSRSQPVCGQQ